MKEIEFVAKGIKDYEKCVTRYKRTPVRSLVAHGMLCM